jgi:hypothetical protein
MAQLWGRQFTRAELMRRVGRLDQVAGVDLIEAGDGASRGLRMLRFTTGSGFGFEVLVDRGFDIGRAWHGSRPISWWSPVGALAPWYFDPSGIEWFRGFPGGLVSTCGLDHTLLGAQDESEHFNYPHRRRETYGLHGRYTGLPAQLTGYGVEWTGDECTLWAAAEVRQVALFGEQLSLTRRIEVPLGGDTLRIVDVVTNIGFTPCSHMLLYHCNVGFPVVDSGAQIVYPAGDGVCVSDASSTTYRELIGPQADFVEECYEHDMRTDPDGLVTAAVVNRDQGIAVYQRYDPAVMPHHITWRNLGEGTYVIAMEPSTNRDAGRMDARARDELQFLQPGDQRSYRLEIGAAVGTQEVDDLVSRISAAAGAPR